MSALPVTVIGGYLGAGKTTLVNHLLRHAGGRRLAVLVNEFGTLPIDADLIEAEGDTLISIAGGCVCCSFGNDLTAALMQMRQLDPRPDHVLIESSGVAIPGSIMATAALLAEVRCDGVVVLADAGDIRRAFDDPYIGDTIARQLAQADIVILNKMDLAPEPPETLTAWVAAQAPGAAVVPCRDAQVPAEVVIGLGPHPVEAHAHAHDHADGLFESIVLTPAASEDAAGLARQIATGPYGVVRAKGWLRTPEGMALIQVAGRQGTATPASPESREGLVCIGLKGQLDIAALHALAARETASG
ncbi:CobW family GTP-binding protein [Seohaeicola zhoushanensis]|uniref:Cobalamin biosynthesis protein CobW n=1 Tax=Seohaeicola zhoushanensis TaxID=1569283 RepID=A0A8J3M856_9RHOB|nr:CobW family GTP-binding protein [Seohaeicola zhoushanensis]GHF51793.1 cobalamin biosynthesis protein CobW [Seohaeicola zhoushanensis]